MADFLTILEILVLAGALFPLFLLLFVSPALLLLRDRGDVEWRLLVAPGVSALLYGALAVVLIPVNRTVLSTVLPLAMMFLVAVSFYRGAWQGVLFQPELRRILYLWFGYYLIAALFSFFPATSIGGLSYGVAMKLSDLAVDNLIPYNVSRYLVERLDPSSLEVVPTWSISDRGPLAGLQNAFLFYFFGLRAGGHWLEARGVYFLTYQSLMCFLNGWIIAAVWLVARRNISPRAADFSLLLFSATYFCLVNVFFAWPKWFMCAFLVAAFESFRSGSKFIGAALLAGAVLAHDSAWLAVIPFAGALIIFKVLQDRVSWRSRAKSGALSAISFLLVLTPWIAAKRYLSPPHPTQLAALQLFCIADARVLGDRGMAQLAIEYFSSTPLSELVRIRVNNLIFPFDVGFVFKSLVVDGLFAGINRAAEHVFKIFVLGVGPVTFFIFLLSLLKSKPEEITKFYPELLGGFGSWLLAAMLLGCEFSTVSHHWAYLAFVVVCIISGGWTAAKHRLGLLLLGAAVLVNMVLLVLQLRIRSETVLWGSASTAYWVLLAALSLLFLVILTRCGTTRSATTGGETSHIARALLSWWIPLPVFVVVLILVTGLKTAIAALHLAESSEVVSSPESYRYRSVNELASVKGPIFMASEVGAGKNSAPLLFEPNIINLDGQSAATLSHVDAALPPGDQVFFADFDGDRVRDVAFFDSRTVSSFDRVPQNWTILLLTAQVVDKNGGVFGPQVKREIRLSWGLTGDRAFVGDFNGDRIGDIAVVNPQSFKWSVIYSADPKNILCALLGDRSCGQIRQWGLPGDQPVAGDFNGDGISEFGVYRPTTGVWHIAPNSRKGRKEIPFGGVGAIATPADFDGDGITELAVYSEKAGVWLLRFVGKGVKSINWSIPNGQPFAIDSCEGLNLAFFVPGENQRISLLSLDKDSAEPLAKHEFAFNNLAPQLRPITEFAPRGISKGCPRAIGTSISSGAANILGSEVTDSVIE